MVTVWASLSFRSNSNTAPENEAVCRTNRRVDKGGVSRTPDQIINQFKRFLNSFHHIHPLTLVQVSSLHSAVGLSSLLLFCCLLLCRQATLHYLVTVTRRDLEFYYCFSIPFLLIRAALSISSFQVFSAPLSVFILILSSSSSSIHSSCQSSLSSFLLVSFTCFQSTQQLL